MFSPLCLLTILIQMGAHGNLLWLSKIKIKKLKILFTQFKTKIILHLFVTDKLLFLLEVSASSFLCGTPNARTIVTTILKLPCNSIVLPDLLLEGVRLVGFKGLFAPKISKNVKLRELKGI